MASINTILTNIAAAIKEDQTIDDWSDNEYDQPVSVLNGCDARNNPGADDCPLVIVFPIQKTGGGSQKQHLIGVSILCCDTEQPASIEGVISFDGQRNVEILRGYVFDVIKGALASDLMIESVTSDYELIEQFPFVATGMELMIIQEWVTGSDQFE